MRRVAFLIPASPVPAFFAQIAAFSLALRRLAWHRWSPSLHVCMGGDADTAALREWLPHLRDVATVLVPAAESARTPSYYAQIDGLYRWAPRDADVLVRMDADTLPVGDLEDLLDYITHTGVIAGVIAHYPFPAAPGVSSREAWRRAARGLIDAPLDFAYTYSLLGSDTAADDRVTPFYLNDGAVFFARAIFDRFAERYCALRASLMDRLADPYYSGQVALALAAAEIGAGTCALPMRYNFPNDGDAAQRYPEELENVKIFHYLRTEAFDRHKIFVDVNNYQDFLAGPLTGVNQAFQSHVRRMFGEEYPFGRDAMAGAPVAPISQSTVGGSSGLPNPASDVTLVLTSCGRQDLLERTLDSFLTHNTYPIYQFIVIEDGDGSKNQYLEQKYKQYPFVWLATGARIGQIAAIDIAYSSVRTDFIFHCEDDWEFFSPGFIEKSFCVLSDRNDILQVCIRSLDDTNGHPILDKVYVAENISYRLMSHHYETKDWGTWHGFNWNPGLRRRQEYNFLGSFGSLDILRNKLPWHIERDASEFYQVHGFYAAILADNSGRGYVRHIGKNRHVQEFRIGRSGFFAPIVESPEGLGMAMCAPKDAPQEQASGVPILAYHSISDGGPPALRPWRITCAALEEQLRFLRHHGYYSVSLVEWANCIAGGTPLQGRPVVITFDDGLKNFITHAAPLLEAFDFRATVFVVTAKVGGVADWDSNWGPPAELMSWDDLRSLEGRGFQVGSHTTAHLDLTTLTDSEILDDSRKALATLRRELGHDVTSVAFPGGRSDARVRAALASGGYRIGVEIRDGYSTLSDDIGCLPRIEILADDDINSFARKLAHRT